MCNHLDFVQAGVKRIHLHLHLLYSDTCYQVLILSLLGKNTSEPFRARNVFAGAKSEGIREYLYIKQSLPTRPSGRPPYAAAVVEYLVLWPPRCYLHAAAVSTSDTSLFAAGSIKV